MSKQSQKKWYSNKALLIALLFVIPPVGIYGMFKRNSKLWKKLVYTFCAFITTFLLLIFSIYIFHTPDYLDNGNTYFKNGFYSEAISEYQKVPKEAKNYPEALKRVEISQFRIDSIDKALKNEEKRRYNENLKIYNELISFQKHWADSIIKDWKGSYITSYKLLKTADTVYFQLSKKATEGNWRSNSDIHQSIFQKQYDSLLDIRFNSKPLKTTIAFLPDSLQLIANQKNRLRREKILQQFSNWNGSHINLVKVVKQQLHDPKSFKHSKTDYEDKGNYILVQMSYRAKNMFGTIVLETVIAKVDLRGNILSINKVN